MASYKNDRINGMRAEDAVLPVIREYFKRDISRKTSRYCKYDYECTEYKYELKSRSNEYRKYPTTIIGIDKLVSDMMIFLFSFTDGLYYIEYEKELFDKFEIQKYVRHPRFGIKDVEKDHLFIPIEELTLIPHHL
jgi:hypothetical protein